jgi:hypothetical protein
MLVTDFVVFSIKNLICGWINFWVHEGHMKVTISQNYIVVVSFIFRRNRQYMYIVRKKSNLFVRALETDRKMSLW